jgi:hypothetical protein
VFKSHGMLGSQRGAGVQVLRNVGFSRRYWWFKNYGMLGSQGGTGDSSLLGCWVLKEVQMIKVCWDVSSC